MSKEFQNKTVFITGAAKGQGRAVALGFAEEGANIIAFDLGEKIAYPAYTRSSNEYLEKLKEDCHLRRRCKKRRRRQGSS